ncbi:MAG: FKBP-type peptidyl-prolyl cis-trans isomerase [Candidatus Azambacteria bacterium]|nr:FKBP-type peptidyl-prolyl cis-trans isomerase [Candidatus Azambacteria bacterium]
MNTRNVVIILVTIFVVIVMVYFIWNKNAKQPESAPVAAPETIKMDGDDKLTTNKQGIQIEVLKEGAGAIAKNGDTVAVHYVGTLENGTKFDSSVDRGTPFEFSLGAGQVIPGWDIGVEGMKIGEARKLTIPSELAYGPNGAGDIIPPNATLIFEVQLLGIK